MYLTAAEIRHHYPALLKVEDVCKITGIDPLTVRNLLKDGTFEFGYALKPDDEKGKWRFIIPTERFLIWFEGKDLLSFTDKLNGEPIDLSGVWVDEERTFERCVGDAVAVRKE